MSNGRQDENLQDRHSLYEKVINEVLAGQYDKVLMQKILNEVDGDINKAQALYVYRTCNHTIDNKSS